MIKSVIYPIITFGLIYLLATSCAKQGTPTGGPKDTIPPNLLISIPENQTINFNSSDLYFEFDEKISADQLKQKLVITPTTELEYEYTVKKNRLTIDLKTPLSDSTTYTFNFSDGVGDITEKNPVVNFKLAISTGPYIDSLRISGKISALQTGKPMKSALVALYDIADTVSVFEKKPKYFSTTDDNGTYLIENIKNSQYLIFSWLDENNSLTYQPTSEAFGFIPDTINLSSNIDSLDIPIQLIDNRELSLKIAKPFGRYFDVRYSKPIDSYKLSYIQSKSSLPYSNLVKEKEYIRFYNTIKLKEPDSIGIKIEALDSLQNLSIDTVYLKFNESKKKPEELTYNLKPPAKSKIQNELRLFYKFNKPIKKFNKDSITIRLDTLITIKTTIDSTVWNFNRTELTYSLNIDWNYINDSIISYNKYISHLDSISFLTVQDSLNNIQQIDTTTNNSDTITNDLPGINRKPKSYTIQENQLSYFSPLGTFISIENDTIPTHQSIYLQTNPEDFGTIFLNINTNYPHYIIQLISQKGEKIQVVRQTTTKLTHTFSKIPPGSYAFRIIVDSNSNGIWDFGNYLKNTAPETTIFPDLKTDLKANWEVNLELEF